MKFENIKINGRYHIENEELLLFNSGSGISFKAKGAGFAVTLCAKPQPCYYYLIVDRDYANKTKLCVFDNSKHQYLFDDKKEHLIDIVKANEAKDNVLTIKELSIDGELLRYNHRYDKRVMVYGDSTIAGYGILSHDVASIHTSDGVQDFAYHALYELNYDVEIMCASGYGLSFSAYTDPKTIGIYDYLNKTAVKSEFSWKKKIKHDILIISLGTNDASYIAEEPNKKEKYMEMFIKKFKGLIDSEVALNEGIKILMIYGTLKETVAYYIFEETYNCLKPLYKNLYIHRFNGDNSGASNHAYVTAHDRMAEELKMVIKSILN